MYFQDIIASLNHYWASAGCLIMQSYDMEVGAGTFHPATLLRCGSSFRKLFALICVVYQIIRVRIVFATRGQYVDFDGAGARRERREERPS